MNITLKEFLSKVDEIAKAIAPNFSFLGKTEYELSEINENYFRIRFKLGPYDFYNVRDIKFSIRCLEEPIDKVVKKYLEDKNIDDLERRKSSDRIDELLKIPEVKEYEDLRFIKAHVTKTYPTESDSYIVKP